MIRITASSVRVSLAEHALQCDPAANPSTESEPNLQKIKHLRGCLEAAKEFHQCCARMPVADTRGLSMMVYLGYRHAVGLVYAIQVLEEPHW
jgi:hypothetical protein